MPQRVHAITLAVLVSAMGVAFAESPVLDRILENGELEELRKNWLENGDWVLALP